MAELYNKIQADAVAARKAAIKNVQGAHIEARAKALSFLLSEIQAKMKTDRVTDISDPDTVVQVRKLRKENEETLAKLINYPDKAAPIQLEIEILDEYLPVALSEEEINTLASTVIAELGATSQKDMGNVMKGCMARNPTIDRSAISSAIKALLVPKIA